VRHLIQIERILGIPGAIGERFFRGSVQASVSR
jgi:hypothetical protein